MGVEGLLARWFQNGEVAEDCALHDDVFGQNMAPMFLLSVIMLQTGTVTKEFMLTNALHWAFATYDIARMTTTCEAVGIPKKLLYPYLPLAPVISYLSYAAW